MKDSTKRFIFWPLHDNSINAIMRKAKWTEIKAPQTQPKPDQQVGLICQRPPHFKSNDYDCKKPSKFPKMIRQTHGAYEYPDAERKSEVALFMLRKN